MKYYLLQFPDIASISYIQISIKYIYTSKA